MSDQTVDLSQVSETRTTRKPTTEFAVYFGIIFLATLPLAVLTWALSVIRSGSLREHLRSLNDHTLDVILSNRAVPSDAETTRYSTLLDDQSVALIGESEQKVISHPEEFHDLPLILPTKESSIRQAFDHYLDQIGVRPVIIAEVDDMAMIRLIARQTKAYALVPPVVVKDELDQGTLKECYHFPNIHETFYAITQDRRYPNELVRILLQNMQ